MRDREKKTQNVCKFEKKYVKLKFEPPSVSESFQDELCFLPF